MIYNINMAEMIIKRIFWKKQISLNLCDKDRWAVIPFSQATWDFCCTRPRAGPHIVLLLKVYFLPDMQAAKSTVTIQFSTFHDCSATPEPKPHTSADKRLHTPRKVGAKSSLHSISLTLAWLPVRHFNLISFPKLEAVLIVKASRTRERYPHMYTHSHTHTGTWRHTPPLAEARLATDQISRDLGLTSTQRPTDSRVCQASPSNRPVSNYVINQGRDDGQVLN